MPVAMMNRTDYNRVVCYREKNIIEMVREYKAANSTFQH